jgi:circadian clock protein KaiC
MKKISSGIPGMDDLLYGGFLEGKSILLTGTCGTGKTTFAAQFVMGGFKNKESCVFITFEQEVNKLIEDMSSVNVNFKDMIKKKKLAVIGGPLGQVSFFKKKTKALVEDIINEIIEVVENMRASRVVIDSINLFNMLFENDSERRNAMTLLTSKLSELNCTTLLISEVPENSKRLGWFGFEDFVVDGVIKVSREMNENRCFRTINVIKMRGSPIIADLREMEINKKGVLISSRKLPSSSSLF